MEKRILLLSNHPDDATFLAEVAAKTNSDLEVVSSADRAADIIVEKSPQGVFIDISKIAKLREFEAAMQKKVGLFSDLVKPEQIYMMSENELSVNREAVLSPYFSNYFQRPIKDIAENGAYYGSYVQASNLGETQKLKNYLSKQGEIQQIQLNHTSQKQEAVEEVRQYFIAAKIPARIANLVSNAVDELIMNAMFDAPCDDFGRSLYSSTSRSQARSLTGREMVEMSIGFDGFVVAVNVTDHYGSIDRQRLLNHISANYKDRDYTVKQGQAGAGLGLATVHGSGASLIYHCTLKQKTETTLLCKAFPAYREFKGQFKFFSAQFCG